jgi:hypothetical protein
LKWAWAVVKYSWRSRGVIESSKSN